MTIKYMGPRPMISHHGIEFKDGKEDKYVYLMIGIQILKAIDKDYGENKTYSYDLSTKRISDDEMLRVMQKYEPTLEKLAIEENQNYKSKIQKEIQNIKERNNLKEAEKEAWTNNLEIMKDYRIQRAINKIYYMHCVKSIKEIIKRENIKEIDTPFYEKYWHVLQTIQGSLEEGRSSLRTNLKVVTDGDNKMTAKLFIGV